ncbi:hypothetical protein [Burkholderia sp. BCC1988]|uniref:hypothetical protein n=1 Tax=Burkholderia sp. BCC1988 TaxID=2817443 RepID=UPI002AB211FA|nr:hypothetical protein [Burkholderia sp. BCC1988]
MFNSFKALIEKMRSNIEHRLHLADELEALEARVTAVEAYLPKPAPAESAPVDGAAAQQA